MCLWIMLWLWTETTDVQSERVLIQLLTRPDGSLLLLSQFLLCGTLLLPGRLRCRRSNKDIQRRLRRNRGTRKTQGAGADSGTRHEAAWHHSWLVGLELLGLRDWRHLWRHARLSHTGLSHAGLSHAGLADGHRRLNNHRLWVDGHRLLCHGWLLRCNLQSTLLALLQHILVEAVTVHQWNSFTVVPWNTVSLNYTKKTTVTS